MISSWSWASVSAADLILSCLVHHGVGPAVPCVIATATALSMDSILKGLKPLSNQLSHALLGDEGIALGDELGLSHSR